MIKSILILAVFFCTACASPQKFEEKVLKPWEGKNVNDLISSWGIPSDVYQFPNKTKTFYRFSSAISTMAITTSHPVYNGRMGITNFASYSCKVTWLVKDEILESWRWEGNSCVSN